MTETIDQGEITNGKKKLPSFLVVLLVITSLNIAYGIFNTASSLLMNEDLEIIQEQVYESLEESGTDLNELPAAIVNAFEDFFPRFIDNYYVYSWYQVIFYLLMIIPVVLMFQLKKLGYRLYVLLQVIGAFDFLFFFGTNWVTILIATLFGIAAAVWILLYWLNVKHMS